MRYMGGKSRIAKDIVPIIQSYIDSENVKTYIEPFVGGASVIDKVRCENRIGFDNNKYLIALLTYVRDGGKLLDSVPKELYDEVRDYYNGNSDNYFPDWFVGNVGFLASYNGRFFDGGYAKVVYEKTKNGVRLRDYYREGVDNLNEQRSRLQNITFITKDLKEWGAKSYKDTLFYFDPPYLNTKKYDTSKNFDYDYFYDLCRELSKNNIVIVSEQYMPDDFEVVWEKQVSRSIKVKNKSVSTEKLFYIGSRNK